MWIRKGRHYVFMDAAGDGGDPGGGAASGDAGTTAAAGAADGAAGTGGDPAGGQTALQAGADTGAVSIPEKYQVKKEDGSIDIEASSLKLAEAYGHLEKRLGSGDAPPKTAEELLATLEGQGLPQAVARLRPFVDLL